MNIIDNSQNEDNQNPYSNVLFFPKKFNPTPLNIENLDLRNKRKKVSSKKNSSENSSESSISNFFFRNKKSDENIDENTDKNTKDNLEIRVEVPYEQSLKELSIADLLNESLLLYQKMETISLTNPQEKRDIFYKGLLILKEMAFRSREQTPLQNELLTFIENFKIQIQKLDLDL